MKLFTLAVLLSLSGCSARYGDHYDIVVSPAFSPDNQVDILNALHAWQNAVGEDQLIMFYRLGECSLHDARNLVCVHAAPQSYVRQLAHNSIAVGWTHRSADDVPLPFVDQNNSSDVWLSVDLPATVNFSQITLHEFGHAWGLNHTGWNTVMCADLGCEPPAISCKDIQQYEEVRHEEYIKQCPED